MLDFDSEDIDGMDAYEGYDQEPAPIGHWKATSSYDIYMLDTPKQGMAMKKRRTTPPRSNQSADVSGAALNPAKARMANPAPETSTPRTVPKTSPSSRIQHRRTKEPALMRERTIERSRKTIICLPPKTRQASTTTNSSCQRIPSNKSVSNAGLWPRQAASRKNSSSLELTKTC
nr:predicted protein [Triticum aestivum]